jgi:hypothetical protein
VRPSRLHVQPGRRHHNGGRLDEEKDSSGLSLHSDEVQAESPHHKAAHPTRHGILAGIGCNAGVATGPA